jgi:hypothetical protein
MNHFSVFFRGLYSSLKLCKQLSSFTIDSFLMSFRMQKFHVFPEEIIQTNKKPVEKMRGYLEASTKMSITVHFFRTTWIVAFIWSIARQWAVEGLGRHVAEPAGGCDAGGGCGEGVTRL